MYHKPADLNPRELARRIKIVRDRLMSQNFENYTGTWESIPIKWSTSVGSTPNKTKTMVVTFSTAVYNQHANSPGKINEALANTMKSHPEWKLEAGYCILLLFILFVCSVICFYCILRKLEDTMCYEDDWMDENLYLETYPKNARPYKTVQSLLYADHSSNQKELSEKDGFANCPGYDITDESTAKLTTLNSSKKAKIYITKTSGVKPNNQVEV